MKIKRIPIVIIFSILLCLCLTACKSAVKLDAPSIGLDENNRVFWTSTDNAIGYKVFVNDEPRDVVQSREFPAIQTEGVYTIQVVAVGDGKHFLDSDKSAAVSYTVQDNKILSPLPADFDFFDRKTVNGKVFVLNGIGYNSNEKLFAESLQGLCAAESVGVYIRYDTSDDLSLLNGYATENTELSKLAQFAFNQGIIKGYVKAENAADNLAKTVCSLYGAVIATDDAVKYLPSGCEKLFDTATESLENVPNDIKELLSEKIVVNSVNYTDLGIMNKALFTDDESIADAYGNGIVLGQGSALCNADFGVKRNLSVLSMLPIRYVRNSLPEETAADGKHYVTLIGQAGSRIDYVSCGYGISLFESNLAPALLDAEQKRSTKDLYLAGDVFSNTNWQALTSERKNEYCSLINVSMSNIEANYITLNAADTDALDKLAYMSNVYGGFVNGTNKTVWKNGKPFVGFCATLTDDNVEDLATKISAMSTEKYNAECYTAIYVAPNTDAESVKLFCAYLNTNVQILRGDVFMQALSQYSDKTDFETNLPKQADASYLTSNHDEYDVFTFKYSQSSPLKTHTFVSAASHFKASASANVAYSDDCCFLNYSGSSNSYLYGKIALSNWEKQYLNLQLSSAKGSSLKVTLYSVQDNKFCTLFEDRVKSRGFQIISLDLNKASFGDVRNKDIVVIIQQSYVSHPLKLKKVSVTQNSERDEILDWTAADVGAGLTLDLNRDVAFNGNVAYDGGLTLRTNEKNYYNEALASVGKKVHLPTVDDESYTLKIDIVNAQNAMCRVSIVDSEYVSNIIGQWTLINGDKALRFDISQFAGENVVLYVELGNKDFEAASLSITDIAIERNAGRYYNATGEKDSFNGTADNWNLCGWFINADASYGDLTQESGYGSLRFDGSNNGSYNPDLAIAQAWKYFALPDNDCTLSFYARSGGPANATYLRIKVVLENGTEIVVKNAESNANGWILVSGEPWLLHKFDLSEYKGRNIKLVIEQTDHGTGVGEIAFVDSIEIKET